MAVLNKHKICIITAVNDEAQYNEMLAYLRELEVPAGMELESLVVWEAGSMTEAYQQGMESSDAKYKVYLHQDCWLVDTNCLETMVQEFRSHPEYGIAGVVGSHDIPSSGIWWEGHVIGQVVDNHYFGLWREYIYERSGEAIPVKALDGVCLMTQYDIPWRQDIFSKWHFYDISQCMEFQRKGYLAVVMPQQKTWVVHNCGATDMDMVNETGYEEERLKFVQEYQHEFLR